MRKRKTIYSILIGLPLGYSIGYGLAIHNAGEWIRALIAFIGILIYILDPKVKVVLPENTEA